MKKILFCLLLISIVTVKAQTAKQISPPVAAWLAAQTNLQTWSADFTQTRKFKSLTTPLVAHGRVWFSAPNRFRWELGTPPQTIAVRSKDELLLFYPQLKRVERFPLTGEQTGPWRDAITMLDAGFPRSEKDLQSTYNILSQTDSGDVCKLILQPKTASARRMMPQVEIDFDMKNFLLRGTELEFADGSTMRNDFTNIVANPKLDEQKFSPPIPDDYQIVEPLKKQ